MFLCTNYNVIAKLQKRLVFKVFELFVKVIKTRINRKIPKVAKTRCVSTSYFSCSKTRTSDSRCKSENSIGWKYLDAKKYEHSDQLSFLCTIPWGCSAKCKLQEINLLRLLTTRVSKAHKEAEIWVWTSKSSKIQNKWRKIGLVK